MLACTISLHTVFSTMEQQNLWKGNKNLILNEDIVKPLLLCEDLPVVAKELLEENVDLRTHNKENIKCMLKELKDFLKNKIKQVVDTSENTDKGKLCKILKSSIKLLRLLVEDKEFVETFIYHRLITTLSYLLSFDNFDDFSLQNQTSQLCEKYLEFAHVEHGSDTQYEIGVCTLKFLLKLTLGKIANKTVTKVDIKRVWDMKTFICKLKLLNPEMEDVKDMLLECCTSVPFLTSREGRLHIASILSNEITLVRQIQENIRQKLGELTEKESSHYGEIYFNAWNTAKPEVQREIEIFCIQDLMENVFTLKRNGLKMSPIGKRIFAILSSLHSSRRKPKFSNTITELYAPLMWRYLRSDHPLERCNAAEVFLDVFPLEKTSGGNAVKSQFREKQLKEMTDLLLDDCHLVRIIAIKGVCYHLDHSLDCLAITDVKKLLSILTGKLASDGSSHHVRVAVFEGLEYMLSRPRSAELVADVLKALYLHIHDENDKVRRAFVKILLKLRDGPQNVDLSYWNVVPLEHLVARLCEEDELVGEPLADLLIKDVYVKGQPVDKTISRLVKLIDLNPNSPRKLFKFSKSYLDEADAYAIIISIVGSLRKKLKDKLESDNNDNSENEAASSQGNDDRSSPSRKKNKILGDISNCSPSKKKERADEPAPGSSAPNHAEENKLIDNHSTVAALISSASILFVQFSNQLFENAKYAEDLCNISIAFVPFFLLHFRNTIVYYAVINYASLIPITKLAPVSTVAGACMSELKEMTDDTPSDVLECLTFSLCAWNRGHEIIELALEWLNYAFRVQDLSGSVMPVRKCARITKVRFKPEMGKPLLAIKLLDCLLDNFWNEKRLVQQSYNTLFELYLLLDRIKVLLERRFFQDCPFDNILTDEFLFRCFKRYISMPSHLHRPDKPPDSSSFIIEGESVDASKEFVKLLIWVNRCLMANLAPRNNFFNDKPEEEELPLAVKCLVEVITNCNLIITLNLADIVFAKAVGVFVLGVLSTDWSIHFIEKSVDTVKVLTMQADAQSNNEQWNLFKTLLPSLLSKVLETIALVDLTDENISAYISDVRNMKLSLFTYLGTTLRNWGVESDYFKNALSFYLFSCIAMIVNEIRKGNDFTAHKKIDDHPLMVRVIMWHLLKKGPIAHCILSSLNEQITLNKKDGMHLLGCLSLLYTLAYSAQQMLRREQFECCVQNAYLCIKGLKSKNNSSNSPLDCTELADSSDLIDAVYLGDSIIVQLCKYIGCAPKKFTC